MTNLQLLREAQKARVHAYAPYSKHKVGAVLETKKGTLYYGCNIENAAYGPSNCAERTAFFKAVYEGEREFTRIAVAGGIEEQDLDNPCAPCGVCRQVMREFCDPEQFRIILADGAGGAKEYLLKELLPFGFGPENLHKAVQETDRAENPRK